MIVGPLVVLSDQITIGLLQAGEGLKKLSTGRMYPVGRRWPAQTTQNQRPFFLPRSRSSGGLWTPLTMYFPSNHHPESVWSGEKTAQIRPAFLRCCMSDSILHAQWRSTPPRVRVFRKGDRFSMALGWPVLFDEWSHSGKTHQFIVIVFNYSFSSM